MKKFIISIDAGTTSNRSILFDLKGKPVISSQKELSDGIQYLMDNDIRTKNEYQITDAFEVMLKNGHRFQPFKIECTLDCGIPETILSTNKHVGRINVIVERF